MNKTKIEWDKDAMIARLRKGMKKIRTYTVCPDHCKIENECNSCQAKSMDEIRAIIDDIEKEGK